MIMFRYGEDGFASKILEIILFELTTSDITIVVGLLGTNSIKVFSRKFA